MKKLIVALLAVTVMITVSACQTGGVAVEGQPVQSEALQKVDYKPESKDLYLVFERGTYKFADVPQDVYDGLMSSSSKGAYYQQNIKGKYEASKIK